MKLGDYYRRQFAWRDWARVFAALPPLRGRTVLDAWRARLDGMTLLRDFYGTECEALRDDFLACLARTDHWSIATVRFCLATKKE